MSEIIARPCHTFYDEVFMCKTYDVVYLFFSQNYVKLDIKNFSTCIPVLCRQTGERAAQHDGR